MNKKYFAILDKNNVVVNSCIAEEKAIAVALFPEFIVEEVVEPQDLHIGGMFINGIFTSPKPHDSWVLSDDGKKWQAPTPCPIAEEGYYVAWNESIEDWEIISKDI